ncbi:MAG: cell division protein FtsL [Candidatus Syntrophopropionicum ammoniitolerans]
MIVAQEKTGYYRFPTEETPPVKKITRRKRTLRNRHKLVFIGLVLAAFLVGVAITVFCSQISTLGYKITRLEKELALLHKENYNLNEEIQKMSSLGRIEYIAVNKLGMKKPDDNNILVVNLNEIDDADGIPIPL